MNDLEIAKNYLKGHTLVLAGDNRVILRDDRGIAPMMNIISEGLDVKGWSAADTVVGKGAAMLFIKAGISSIYAGVVSKPAFSALASAGINCTFEKMVPNITNRDGTDICPMEKAVMDTEDVDEAYITLNKKLAGL